MKCSAYWLSCIKSRMAAIVVAPFLFAAAAAAFLVPMLQSSHPNVSPLKQTLVTEILLVGTGVAVLCIVGRFILKPLRQLDKAMQEIVRGEAGSVVRMRRKDEIGILADSLNQLVQYHRTIEQALACFSRGHFDSQVPELAGRHPMFRAIALVHSAMNEMRSLIQKAQEGCLDTPGDAGEYPGIFGELIQAMHQLMCAMAQPIHEATRAFESVARRDLRTRIQGNYVGDYARMKDSVNAALNNLDQQLKQVISHSAGGAV